MRSGRTIRPPRRFDSICSTGARCIASAASVGQSIVYADTGEEQLAVLDGDGPSRRGVAGRVSASRTATVEDDRRVDQWTVQTRLRDLQPLYKFSFPNGSRSTSLRTPARSSSTRQRLALGAYVGAIPHWLYFTPLRKHGAEWSKSSSGRRASAPARRSSALSLASGCIRRRKSTATRARRRAFRTVVRSAGTCLGLVFGLARRRGRSAACCRWIRFRGGRTAGGRWRADRERRHGRSGRIRAALHGEMSLEAFARQASEGRAGAARRSQVKELQLTSFMGTSGYLATLADGTTRIVPVDGRAAITGFIAGAHHRGGQEGGGGGRPRRDRDDRSVRHVLSRSPSRAAAAGGAGAVE